MLAKNKQEAIQVAKEKLWSYGYRVADFSDTGITEFDLIINKKFRVKVGRRKLEKIPSTCDVYIFVGHVAFFYEKEVNGKLIIKSSPYEVFGK